MEMWMYGDTEKKEEEEEEEEETPSKSILFMSNHIHYVHLSSIMNLLLMANKTCFITD